MRLTDDQVQAIRQLAHQVAGSQARVRVLGFRLDDAAQMSTKVSRLMHGRKVDVLISAPNLMRLPIHEVALKEGQLL